MAYFIIFGAILLAAAAGYRFVCQSRDRSKPVCYFRCPSCKQKLRFEAGNEGRRIMCPRCLKTCTLSEASPEQVPAQTPDSAFYARRK